jgi:hypothetical protein
MTAAFPLRGQGTAGRPVGSACARFGDLNLLTKTL